MGSDPRESDRVLMVAALPLFPNDSSHPLNSFVTVTTGSLRWTEWYMQWGND